MGEATLGDGPRVRIALLMISNFGVADGGRETWAYNFIPRLLRRWPGVTLDVIGLNREHETDNSERLLAILQKRGAVTFLRSRRRRWVVLSALRRDPPVQLLTKRQPAPDLVIAVGSIMELLVVLSSPALRRAPRVVWLRTILADEKAARLPKWAIRILRPVEIRLLRCAHLLIANGEDTAAYYRRRGLTVTVIANGVDAERWRSDPPALNRPLRVLLVGRLMPAKGFVEYLDLGKRLHGEFEFHVAGEGPLEKLAERAHNEGWLVNHGSKPNSELPALLASMDVCVGFSFHSPERGGGGVSNALLEQMAAGRVIVAWRNEIYGQLLDDTNAYLVPQGDVAAAYRVLNDIRDRPDEARRRAAAAQETAKRFSFEVHLGKFTTAVQPLLAGHRATRADPLGSS
jgi:glycosyltransferase involved in cell wall biosynthesis